VHNISTPDPPPILRGKLEFGNPVQIKALREYEAVLDKHDDGEMGRWEVDIEISSSRTVTVMARNEAEAEEKAERFAQQMLDDADIEISARRMQ